MVDDGSNVLAEYMIDYCLYLHGLQTYLIKWVRGKPQFADLDTLLSMDPNDIHAYMQKYKNCMMNTLQKVYPQVLGQLDSTTKVRGCTMIFSFPIRGGKWERGEGGTISQVPKEKNYCDKKLYIDKSILYKIGQTRERM